MSCARAARTRFCWEFYQELIALRKKTPALTRLAKESMEVVGCENEKVLVVRRCSAANHVVFVANLSADRCNDSRFAFTAAGWRKLIDSAAPNVARRRRAARSLDGGTEHRLTFASRSFAVFDCALSTRGPE